MNRTIRRLVTSAILLGSFVTMLGCSAFTSISRDTNGDYVITGWEAPGPHGIVWICDYDPATKTLTVKERY